MSETKLFLESNATSVNQQKNGITKRERNEVGTISLPVHFGKS